MSSFYLAEEDWNHSDIPLSIIIPFPSLIFFFLPFLSETPSSPLSKPAPSKALSLLRFSPPRFFSPCPLYPLSPLIHSFHFYFQIFSSFPQKIVLFLLALVFLLFFLGTVSTSEPRLALETIHPHTKMSP